MAVLCMWWITSFQSSGLRTVTIGISCKAFSIARGHGAYRKQWILVPVISNTRERWISEKMCGSSSNISGMDRGCAFRSCLGSLPYTISASDGTEGAFCVLSRLRRTLSKRKERKQKRKKKEGKKETMRRVVGRHHENAVVTLLKDVL